MSDELREAAAAMLEPINHRSHEHAAWPSIECDDCLAVRKRRADRLRVALAQTPAADAGLSAEEWSRQSAAAMRSAAERLTREELSERQPERSPERE